jgi:AcrR family transcriptional regulator
VQQLLAAAEKLLAGGGYEGLRVDDVLHEAGLSTRAFYRHFRGKSELFLALFDREAALAGDRLRRKVASARTPAAKVEAWVAATLALSALVLVAPWSATTWRASRRLRTCRPDRA